MAAEILAKALEETSDARRDFLDNEYESHLRQPMEDFFNQRITLYESLVHNSTALGQITSMSDALNTVYRDLYNTIFKQLDGDIGFKEFQQRIKECKEEVDGSLKKVQSSTDLLVMYEHALAVQPLFKEFCTSIASQTDGIYQYAPIKSMFRTVEKTAFRAEKQRRFQTEDVLDLVRGALVYETFGDLSKGLTALVESRKFFKVLRIKDRFATPTSAGWRDVVVNGTLTGDRNRHAVEIQLHYKVLVTVREDLGGHFIYAKQRALVEALESIDEQLKMQVCAQ
jgi:hypothetical protein